MNVQQIVNLSRQLAYTDSTQYTDAVAIEDFNNLYHDLENDIVRFVDEDYYYDIEYSDLVANQIEYPYPLSTSGISGMKKMKWLSIKYMDDSCRVSSYDNNTKVVELEQAYSWLVAGMTVKFTNKEWYVIHTDTVATINVAWLEFVLTTGSASLAAGNLLKYKDWIIYQRANNVSLDNFPMDEGYYRDTQPQYMPMYKISDKSLRIYPVSPIDVVNGIKIYIIRDQIDLTISATESDINIPRQYHNFIAYWMVPRIYQRRWMANESDRTQAVFDAKRDEMMKELSNRNISPVSTTLLPTKNLE